MFHWIVEIEDINQLDSKFILVENYWGLDSNWKGPYSWNSDEIDWLKN